MSNEPSTIFYRQDFIRPGEQQKTKKERHAIYERNRRKATASEHCWGCRFFTDCSMGDNRNCERWRLDK